MKELNQTYTLNELSRTSISGQLFVNEINKEDVENCNRLFHESQFQACYDFSKTLLLTTPQSRVARLSIAKSAVKLQKTDEAFAILFSILAKNPKDSQAIDILASAYKTVNKNDKATRSAERALVLDKDNAGFHVNLALHYFDEGLLDKALYHYEEGIRLGDLASAYFGKGLTLLASRQYQQGWLAYEARFRLESSNVSPVKLDIPYWDKTTSLDGKKLMICWEQGLGDNIQFMRFIPLLKQKHHPKISVACNNALAPLFKQIPEIDKVIHGKYLIMQEMDYQISMLSLPYYLDIYQETQFFNKPYITAESNLIEKWSSHFNKQKKLRVGFCWRGRKDYINAMKRNICLDDFISLWGNPHVEFISLQRGLTDGEKEILHYSEVTSLGDTVGDLADTAAVMASLDLVISVDTAIAHLAGAMGKPVWTLIRYETEWRHPRGCDISPWYPSMRLFRQAKPGDWHSVFERVERALLEFNIK